MGFGKFFTLPSSPSPSNNSSRPQASYRPPPSPGSIEVDYAYGLDPSVPKRPDDAPPAYSPNKGSDYNEGATDSKMPVPRKPLRQLKYYDIVIILDDSWIMTKTDEHATKSRWDQVSDGSLPPPHSVIVMAGGNRHFCSNQQLWVAAANATDGAQAAQTLAEILADKDGKVFILRVDSRDVELCIEILGNVSVNLRLPRSQPQVVWQGIVEHDLKPVEKQAPFVTLRRFAERHGLLPSRTRIARKIEVSDELLASSGFADLRSGMYGERLVAIKTLRVAARDEYVKIRKVSININDGHPGHTHSIISLQRVCKEIASRSTLFHLNVSKLVGVQEDINKWQSSIVSEWMLRGNIMKFIENNHANRLELVHSITFPTTSFAEARR